MSEKQLNEQAEINEGKRTPEQFTKERLENIAESLSVGTILTMTDFDPALVMSMSKSVEHMVHNLIVCVLLLDKAGVINVESLVQHVREEHGRKAGDLVEANIQAHHEILTENGFTLL